MRRIASVLLYLAIGLPLALSSMLALSAKPWALDRTFYHRAVADQRLYEALRSPEFPKSVEDRIEIEGRVFSGPALAKALQGHLPEAELKLVLGEASDRLVDALAEGKSGDLSLSPLKTRLAKDLPALTEDYLAALPAPPAGAALPPGDFSAKPAALPAKGSGQEAGKALESLVEAIPASIRISGDQADARSPHVTGIGASLDALAGYGSAGAAFLLLGLGFLGGGGVGRSLARAGRYLVLPSVIVLGVGLLLALPGAPIASMLPVEARAAVSTALPEALRAWLSSWLGIASRSFFVVGLVGASLGGFLASLRRIVEPKEF